MKAIIVNCNNCGANIEVNSYRKIVVCPFCDSSFDFDGFEYCEIDWNSSMYAGVSKWTDCPVCRSENMFLGAEKKVWKCPDCGYVIKDKVYDFRKVGIPDCLLSQVQVF